MTTPTHIQRFYTFSIDFDIKERVLVPELEPDIIKLIEDDAQHTYTALTRAINNEADYLIANIRINCLEPLDTPEP